MRLIDADELVEIVNYTLSSPPFSRKKVLNMIEMTRTLDAVPVVRCKDCKHRDEENGFCEGRGWPMQLVPDDGFCDKGKRSEDETN